ncbi:MAG: hypothetical protein QCH35_00705 [Methanomicrobiaceae archaeon]|nr:hypothetical protein [Methanomicrobiaceae archaeon]
MSNEKMRGILGLGFSIGLIMGTGIWSMAAILSGLDIIVGMTYGAGTGIITGLLTAQAYVRDRVRGSTGMLVVFGMGAGTLVGIPAGLLAAWSWSFSPLSGFFMGAGAGLIGGALIGAILRATVKGGQEIGE